ncbi:MAG: tRNA pseudouridine(13) synthase TruD, partial [Candidatus Odinarchaeota archaeon]
MSELETASYSFKENNEREVEKFVGIQAYATHKMSSLGGEYKKIYKDFIVREVDAYRKVLNLREDSKSHKYSEELKDKYTTFNLVKINKDTFEALRNINKVLNVPYNLISYSGLKDKYSISVQKISIKGDFVEKLKKIKIQDIFIRNIIPTKKPIKVGSHWGNHFTIILRNIENNKNLKSELENYVNYLTSFGFPNYFGLQRFGNYRPNSHIVGRFLLEGNFKNTFEEFVTKTYSTESIESRKARKHLEETGNLEKALKEFPDSLNYEKKMIKYLLENPKDYEGSVNTLSTDLKKLLISSFQSYLFNRMLSKRVEEQFSLFNPIKGDVISILDDFNGNITQVKYIYGNDYDKYLNKALSLNRAAIILPIIGKNTNLDDFPLMKSLYEKVLNQENIDIKIFNNAIVHELEFKGSIRPITIKPTDLKLLDLDDDDLYPGKKKAKFEFSL